MRPTQEQVEEALEIAAGYTGPAYAPIETLAAEVVALRAELQWLNAYDLKRQAAMDVVVAMLARVSYLPENWRKLHATEECITTRAMLSCAIELERALKQR